MIFIDGSNLHWALRAYNQENHTDVKIDYKKLISFLSRDRTLSRVIYYCSKPIPPGRISQIKFLDYLRSLGIQVIEKPLKVRYGPTDHTRLSNQSIRYVEKGIDVALATDLIGMAWEDAYDTAILVSGDADYSGAINKVMSKGRNVEVASFRKSLSKELKESALIKITLDDYIAQIKV
jgi:uncharacterized LabA/DUF88 family protein